MVSGVGGFIVGSGGNSVVFGTKKKNSLGWRWQELSVYQSNLSVDQVRIFEWHCQYLLRFFYCWRSKGLASNNRFNDCCGVNWLQSIAPRWRVQDGVHHRTALLRCVRSSLSLLRNRYLQGLVAPLGHTLS